MMDKIQRYSVASVAIFTLTYKSSDGDYVRHEDYAALLADAERMRGENHRLRTAIECHQVATVTSCWTGIGFNPNQRLYEALSATPPPSPAPRPATGEEGGQ